MQGIRPLINYLTEDGRVDITFDAAPSFDACIPPPPPIDTAFPHAELEASAEITEPGLRRPHLRKVTSSPPCALNIVVQIVGSRGMSTIGSKYQIVTQITDAHVPPQATYNLLLHWAPSYRHTDIAYALLRMTFLGILFASPIWSSFLLEAIPPISWL